MPDKNKLIMGGSAVAIAIAVGGLLYNAFVYQARKPPAAGAGSPAGSATAPAGAAGAGAPQTPAGRTTASQPGQQGTGPAGDAAGKQNSAAAGPAPSFDIVRVEPSGEAVVAGRTEPGANVELLNRGQPVGKAKADPNGQFVIIPGNLPPGAHQLQLRTTAKDKRTVSRQAVSVSVPDKGSRDVIVALSEPDKPTVILSEPKTIPPSPGKAVQQPAAAPTAQGNAKVTSLPKTPAAMPSQVGIRVVEAEQKGGFFASGFAEAGVRLRIYLNGSHVADVQAGQNGQWSLRVGRGMSPGNYDVRADVIDGATGKVRARAQVPFEYPARVAAAPASAAPAVSASPSAAPGKSPADGPAAGAPAPGQPSEQRASAPPPDTRTGAAAPGPSASAGAPATDSPATRAARAAPAVPAVPAASPPASAASAPEPQKLATPGVAAAILPPPDHPAHVVIEKLQTASVVKGDSLWRISRTMLGLGIRYTQIYEANTDQIRNPHRIYPGQVLVVPLGKAGHMP